MSSATGLFNYSRNSPGHRGRNNLFSDMLFFPGGVELRWLHKSHFIVELQLKEGMFMTAEKGNIMAQALNLTDLTAYQEGSVVSRTLIDKKVGTITVFAFAEGEGLSEHTAPFDAFVQVIDGAAEITIAGVVHSVNAGQMIIMPANRPHSLRALQRFKMLLIMIRA
jgi:quercetin dioxygenase-like cupin family protein